MYNSDNMEKVEYIPFFGTTMMMRVVFLHEIHKNFPKTLGGHIWWDETQRCNYVHFYHKIIIFPCKFESCIKIYRYNPANGANCEDALLESVHHEE